jgi:enoyl-CoA hydratase
MPDAAAPLVLRHREDRIAYVTLNRPEKLNALSPALLDELEAALLAADADGEVRVIVLRGAGRSFSTGMDLDAEAGGPWYRGEVREPGAAGAGERTDFEAMREQIQETARRWFRVIWELRKPVVAQVQGHALALGSELALMCDVTIVAQDAQLGYPPATIHGPAGAFYYLWFAGLKKGKELMLTGATVDGEEAVRLGFANRAVPADRLEEETRAMAELIARTPVEILTLSKHTANRIYEQMGMKTSIEWGLEMNTLAYYTEASKRWDELIREQGVKAALAARARGLD